LHLGLDSVAIKVLIADDSDVMRTAIRRVLTEDRRIEIVGEASTFAQTMQMIGDCQPSVLLLDLHLPEQGDFTPVFVKSQLAGVPHILAVSLSNDHDAKVLAASYGARALLDKISLYEQMIPAIIQCCEAQTKRESTLLLRKNLKRKSYAA
jgi:Chemotaxis response regulator containing a CheY-like receiver domain and a methylesterase domain